MGREVLLRYWQLITLLALLRFKWAQIITLLAVITLLASLLHYQSFFLV